MARATTSKEDRCGTSCERLMAGMTYTVKRVMTGSLPSPMAITILSVGAVITIIAGLERWTTTTVTCTRDPRRDPVETCSSVGTASPGGILTMSSWSRRARAPRSSTGRRTSTARSSRRGASSSRRWRQWARPVSTLGATPAATTTQRRARGRAAGFPRRRGSRLHPPPRSARCGWSGACPGRAPGDAAALTDVVGDLEPGGRCRRRREAVIFPLWCSLERDCARLQVRVSRDGGSRWHSADNG
jgi:hypothetical protein